MRMKNRLYKFFAKHNNIIIFAFAACMLFMLIMMGIYYVVYSKNVKKNELKSVQQTIEQIANNIDKTLSSIKFTIEFVSTNDIVLEQIVYNDDGDYKSQLKDLNKAWSMIGSIENYQYVHSAEFYIDDRKAISKEHVNYFGWSDAENEWWYDSLMSQRTAVMWVPPYVEGPASGENAVEVFSCISTIKDYKKSIVEPVAIIKLDCESRELYKIIDNVSINNNVFIGICDNDNKVIFSGNKDKIGKNIDDEIAAMKSGTNYKICADIPITGWKMVTVISDKSSFYDMRVSPVALTAAIVGVIVFCVMLIILLYIVFSKNFIIRISGLVSEFEANEEREEVLDNRLEQILTDFKEMIARKYNDEILLKEAEFKSLQAQINPHFLYNTLDSIRWLVRQEDNRSAENMLNDLARYFRFSLSKSKDVVTIENEIDIANAYMRIQTHRFGNKFTYETYIDDAVLQYKIPKLTIQPFLENVLLHGMNDASGNMCNINVAAVEDDDYIEICISDNGKGMTDEQIKKLFGDCGGYGVYNVNRRLLLFSDNKEGCGIEVHSKPGRYTSVILKIKKVL